MKITIVVLISLLVAVAAEQIATGPGGSKLRQSGGRKNVKVRSKKDDKGDKGKDGGGDKPDNGEGGGKFGPEETCETDADCTAGVCKVCTDPDDPFEICGFCECEVESTYVDYGSCPWRGCGGCGGDNVCVLNLNNTGYNDCAPGEFGTMPDDIDVLDVCTDSCQCESGCCVKTYKFCQLPPNEFMTDECIVGQCPLDDMKKADAFEMEMRNAEAKETK